MKVTSGQLPESGHLPPPDSISKHHPSSSGEPHHLTYQVGVTAPDDAVAYFKWKGFGAPASRPVAHGLTSATLGRLDQSTPHTSNRMDGAAPESSQTGLVAVHVIAGGSRR